MEKNKKWLDALAKTMIIGGIVFLTGCSHTGNKAENNTFSSETVSQNSRAALIDDSSASLEETDVAEVGTPIKEVSSADVTKMLSSKESLFIFFGKQSSKEYQHYQAAIKELSTDVAEKIYFMDESKEKGGQLYTQYMFDMALENGKYENLGVYFEKGNPKRIWGPTFTSEEIASLFNGESVDRAV
ncbi:hypothetical protein ACYSNR_12370 [Enterococcus sp. LJL128]|uniref:hypothetical protein n=1 Tax=Enterococcus sp. LJL51 TaxID=3416656 RepID=UPI003CEC2BA7